MEEKNVIKISLSTILLIFAIIIIAIMWGVIFKLSSEKNVEIQRATELETQVMNLNSTVNNLQEKINKVSETINSENTTNVEKNYVVEHPTNNESTTVQDKYTEITSKLNEDDLFYVTDAVKNSDDTYTLKGVIYTRFTLSKSELENAAKSGSYKYLNQYGTDPEYVNYTVKKNYQEDMSDIKYDYAFIGKFKNEDRLCLYASKKDSDTYYIKNTTEFGDEWKLTDTYKKITVSGDVIVENDYDSSKVKNYFNNFENRTASETNSHPTPCYTFEFSNGKCSKIFEMETGH